MQRLHKKPPGPKTCSARQMCFEIVFWAGQSHTVCTTAVVPMYAWLFSPGREASFRTAFPESGGRIVADKLCRLAGAGGTGAGAAATESVALTPTIISSLLRLAAVRRQCPTGRGKESRLPSPTRYLVELILSSPLVGSAAADCSVHRLNQQGFAGFQLLLRREHFPLVAGGWVSLSH